MNNLKVGKVIICMQGKESENYQEFKSIVKRRKIEVVLVEKGDELLIEEDFKIQILWPKPKQIQENILNNNSVVSKIVYKDFSMLLTGDIEEIAEKQILAEYKSSNILRSTILKVRTSWIKNI